MILLAIPLITYVSSLALIIPVTIGIINANDVYKSPLKVIFSYCLIFCCFEVIGWIYALNGWRNHFISNSILYTDVILWGYYYYLIIKNKTQKQFIIGLMCLALMLIIWSHAGRDFNRVDPFGESILNIYLIIISLMLFYQLLNNLEINNLFTYPHFWISIAVLLYFSGVFFMYVFSEYLSDSKQKSVYQFWFIKDYLLLIQRVFIGIGLWYSKELVQSKNLSK